MIKDLIEKGFYQTDISDILKNLDISNISWKEEHLNNVYEPKDNVELDKSIDLINSNLIEMLNQNFKSVQVGKKELWEGTEPTSCVWHNDLVEGWNLFALVYFNDMTEETGGSISFKNAEEEIYTVYPKYGTCIFVNMMPWYYHKVEQVKVFNIKRVVLNCCYNVEY
jgi:hypothetical protein